MPQYFVHLNQISSDAALSQDDVGLAGVYQVEVDCEQDDPHAVTAVLDAFHDHIGIRVLDDFEVGVKNEAGEWVAESDNEDDPDPEDMPRTQFWGKVEPQDLEPCQAPSRNGRMSP